MPPKEFETPAELALAQFLERIDQDTGLSEAVKKAVREDMASTKPGALEKLAAALSAEIKSP